MCEYVWWECMHVSILMLTCAWVCVCIVWMYMCIHAHSHMCVYGCVYGVTVHVYPHSCSHACVCMVQICVCIHVHAHMYMRGCVYGMNVRVYPCSCSCVCMVRLYMCIHIHAHVCVYISTFMLICVCMCVEAQSWQIMSSLITLYLFIYLQTQGLLLQPELPIPASLASHLGLGLPCFCLPSMPTMMVLFLHGCWGFELKVSW